MGTFDHARYIKNMMDKSIDCYASKGTVDECNLSGHRLNIINASDLFQIGTFKILPFDAVHDASEPLNFLIQSGVEKLAFITDTAYVKVKLPPVNYLMVECNYCTDILQENIRNETVSITQKNRLLFSHLSLENVKEFLLANDLTKLKEVYLIHLSSGNSDEKRMKKEVQEIVGVPVYVCGE